MALSKENTQANVYGKISDKKKIPHFSVCSFPEVKLFSLAVIKLGRWRDGEWERREDSDEKEKGVTVGHTFWLCANFLNSSFLKLFPHLEMLG